MDLKRAPPSRELRSVLRAFEERQVDLGGGGLAWPVPARPHQILIFHLAEPYQVRIDGNAAAVAPTTGLVGPQSYRRAHVCLAGSIHVFTVVFQPTGLNRLVGIDMASLVNQDPCAREILGKSAVTLDDAVRMAPDFGSRINAVERWVGNRLDARGPDCAVGLAARRMLADHGNIQIQNLVTDADLSARQFQRRFATQVGMAPKLFARTVRFDRALAARRDAGRSWTDIVHDFGYFDQAHFIRECHAFAGLPPGRLVGDWNNIFFPGG